MALFNKLVVPRKGPWDFTSHVVRRFLSREGWVASCIVSLMQYSMDHRFVSVSTRPFVYLIRGSKEPPLLIFGCIESWGLFLLFLVARFFWQIVVHRLRCRRGVKLSTTLPAAFIASRALCFAWSFQCVGCLVASCCLPSCFVGTGEFCSLSPWSIRNTFLVDSFFFVSVGCCVCVKWFIVRVLHLSDVEIFVLFQYDVLLIILLLFF